MGSHSPDEMTTSTAKAIVDAMLSIQHLYPVVFLTAHNKTVHIGDPDNIVNCPDNISLAKFSCTMDRAFQHVHVTNADTLGFQF